VVYAVSVGDIAHVYVVLDPLADAQSSDAPACTLAFVSTTVVSMLD
jgi:hypothetical protein